MVSPEVLENEPGIAALLEVLENEPGIADLPEESANGLGMQASMEPLVKGRGTVDLQGELENVHGTVDLLEVLVNERIQMKMSKATQSMKSKDIEDKSSANTDNRISHIVINCKNMQKCDKKLAKQKLQCLFCILTPTLSSTTHNMTFL